MTPISEILGNLTWKCGVVKQDEYKEQKRGMMMMRSKALTNDAEEGQTEETAEGEQGAE